MVDHGPDVDISPLHDDEVLERELRESLGKSDNEVELFKTVNRRLRIKGELANSEAISLMLAVMWAKVADFFEKVTEADTLAKLPYDHPLVTLHQEMRANFQCVSSINKALIDGREAEEELIAIDDMDQDAEDV